VSVEKLVLAIETATLAGSVCLLRDGMSVAAIIGEPAVSHSNTLLKDVDRLLEKANVLISDIQLFAVASGPGSFTGLRIGIATVKALAATLNRSCIGIPTLEAIAQSAGSSNRTVCLLPAGRGEVFAQLFSVANDGEVTALDEPGHLSPRRAIEKYSMYGDICWAGEGVYSHLDLIREFASKSGYSLSDDTNVEIARDGWRIAETTSNLAKHVASLAWARFSNRGDLTPDALHAIYVRPSDAELKH
jgi:tRNA threonylcarbamoyladenosine biosynthesis protein TsaB